MKIDVRPLTPNLWPALADLFGVKGACNGCWCMYWRLGAAYRSRPRAKNKSSFREIVKHGPPPGLLAFDGNLAVGWCLLAPRKALPWLNGARWLKPIDDTPVWSIACFYVRRRYRRRGVTSALIAAALRVVKRARAPALEAYPIDTTTPKHTRNLFTGVASSFSRSGFKTVARRTPSRPIMRYHITHTD
jgi:GNAT superfamily N-acetyltransferase